MTLEEMLALLPDNSTGEIDAVDLRTIVTGLWDNDQAVGRLQPAVGSGPLSQFRARLATVNTKPVVVLLFGTSQVAGMSGTEWPALLNRSLQSWFPQDLPEGTLPPMRTLAQYTVNPTLVPGVQIINAGVSGSTAASMIPGASMASVVALAPYVGLFIIDTGTNDQVGQISPEQFGTDLRNTLAPVREAAGEATWLYVHGNERLSYATAVEPWDDYRAEKREIIAEHPDDSAMLDLSDVLRALGVGLGGTDPLDLLADDVHYNTTGNAYYASALYDLLNVPPAPRPVTPPRAWTTLATDEFTGADVPDVNGRVFDNTAGGSTAVTWVSTTVNAAGINNGQLFRNVGGAHFTGFAEPQANYRLKFTLSTAPTGSVFAFWVRRVSSVGGTGNVAGAYLIFQVSGALQFNEVVGTTAGTAIGMGSYASGDQFDLILTGNQIEIYRNHAFLSRVTIQNTAVGFAGFRATSTATGAWRADHFALLRES